jgi:hypothetical protein
LERLSIVIAITRKRLDRRKLSQDKNNSDLSSITGRYI